MNLASLRCGIAALVTGLSLVSAPARSAEPAPDFKVTLLGTGSPNPDIDRFSTSTLVQAGGLNLLFDVGRGTTMRLWQIKLPFGKIDAVFLTHYHSDHTSGLPDLWLTGGIDTPYGRRRGPLAVIGPVGARALTAGIEAAYADDVKIRIADEGLSPEVARFDAREFSGDERVVFDLGGVKVTAFLVDHGEKITPAYGYRVDYRGHAVVLSGDTRFNENLIHHARGVDLLVHEAVIANEAALAANPGFHAIAAHHTNPEEAGEVFKKTRPRLAVFSHLVFLSDLAHPRPTPADLESRTRKVYDGPLVVGRDLMSFDVALAEPIEPVKPR